MAKLNRDLSGGRQSGRPETQGQTTGPYREAEGTTITAEEEHGSGGPFEGSVDPAGPGLGQGGVPSAGPQIFSCDRCQLRFPSYDELMKHQSDMHGA